MITMITMIITIGLTMTARHLEQCRLTIFIMFYCCQKKATVLFQSLFYRNEEIVMLLERVNKAVNVIVLNPSTRQNAINHAHG